MNPFPWFRNSEDRRYHRLIRRIFGISAHNIELYKLALVHRSASVWTGQAMVNNERLEFLGDTILDSVVSECLFLALPDHDEGMLSKLRSRIVSRESLNQLALDLGLEGEIVTHSSNRGSRPNNLYGDALEALVGALFLDRGYDATYRVLVGTLLVQHLDFDLLIEKDHDYKSQIIEWCQKQRQPFFFDSHSTPKHTDLHPQFESILTIGGEVAGQGFGRSKKEAEQQAAAKACSERIG